MQCHWLVKKSKVSKSFANNFKYYFHYFDNYHIKTEFMPKHFQHGPVCKAWLYLILIQSATSPKMYIFLFLYPWCKVKPVTCLMQERQKRKYSSAVEPGLSTWIACYYEICKKAFLLLFLRRFIWKNLWKWKVQYKACILINILRLFKKIYDDFVVDNKSSRYRNCCFEENQQTTTSWS